MTHPEPHIGAYRLLKRLAVGGMAEVFLAQEEGGRGLVRQVVVKRMLPHLASEPRFREMFSREARTAARVNHPNVVQVFELGEEDGLPYIVMEHVPGRTLRDLVEAANADGARLPIAVALDIAAQACAAAHAVHELTDEDGRPLGLVHRDLTPHNLMVTHQGFVKLLDFGIVKGARDDRLTETGVLKGKLSYLSPEQIEQEGSDRRADVFALGAVTWELLAGTKLHQGPNEVAVLRAVLAKPGRDVRDVRPEVPAEISDAIRAAVDRAREGRPATAEVLRTALLSAGDRAGYVPRRDDTADLVRRLLGASEADRSPIATFTAHRPGTDSLPEFPMPTQTSSVVERHARTVGTAGVIGVLLGAAALMTAVALIWRDQGVTHPPPPVPDTYESPAGEPVSFIVAPVSDGASRLSELEPLRRYLEGRLDRPVAMTSGDGYAATVEAVATGQAWFGFVPPGVFLAERARAPGLDAIVSEEIDGSRGADGVILTTDTADLKADGLTGRTICYADPDSTTGHLLARAWLRARGMDPDVDVVPHFSGNHLQVLRDLIDGTCTLAATYTTNWTTANEAGIAVSRTRLVATTGWTPHDVVIVGPSTPPDLRDAVQAGLIALDVAADIGAERIGARERVTGFAPVDAESLTHLADMLRAARSPSASP